MFSRIMDSRNRSVIIAAALEMLATLLQQLVTPPEAKLNIIVDHAAAARPDPTAEALDWAPSLVALWW